MSWTPPTILTLERSPERAALAALAVAATLAKHALLAVHPELGDPTLPDTLRTPTARLAEVLLVHTDLLDTAIASYCRLDDAHEYDDIIF